MFLIHVRNSCSCNLNFLLAAHKTDVAERGTKHKQAMHNFLHHDHRTAKHQQHPRTLSEESPHGHRESKQITVQHSHFQKAVCKERNYTAHMHKQKVAFVRLGRSLGIFSLKCKSTLQRCPKKVTIIISISSIFRHVHVLNSCTQFMFMQSQFFASCAQTRSSQKEEQNTSKPWTTFFTVTIMHHRTTAPKEHFPETVHMTIQKANKLLYSTAISRKLCVRERNYTAHMHKQKAAFVRLGRSLGIFSLKCKSTLQRCPKKVTIIISSIFTHVHASYMHLDAFSGNIRMS